jgi:type I restriction enzyme S subunit
VTASLGDILTFAGVPERISNPASERFVTVRLRGGGAVERKITDGKTPVPFTGYRVQRGQFIYSRIDARNGAFAVVPDDLHDAVVSKDFPVFDIHHDRVVSSYLAHYFRAGLVERTIQAQSRGATNRQRITEDQFLAIPIALPPLTEQRRIATILDHADTLRTKRRQALAHLDTLPQAIFHKMFGAGGFPSVRAGELMPAMRNGLSPSTGGQHHATVLTLSAITQGSFDPSANKPGAFAIGPPADKRVAATDFLMCRGNGNQALVGVGTYSRVDRADLVFPDTVIAGRVNTALVQMEYLSVAWAQRDVRKQIEALARTTNGTFKVNQQSLASIELPLPPLGLQREFAHAVAKLDRRKAGQHTAATAKDELFTSLQSRAFKGEL